jgi:F0F1-type ATP synthase membrane subunit b/b'
MNCDNNCGSCRYQLDPTHCADVVSGAVAEAANELDGLRATLADLGQQLEATRLDRDRALVRCREASEFLIAKIGASGPENVEETAKRAAERISALEQVAASQCDHCEPAIDIERSGMAGHEP